MRGWVVVLAAALAFASTVEAAPSEARRPGVSLPLEGAITNPDWLRRPTGEEMANYYPEVAQLISLNGHAQIICDVTPQGTTVNCVVENETPAGMGFGQAAISLADYFRMKPMTIDGAPVAGGKVTIPIGFMVPANDDEISAPEEGSLEAAPSTKALELARRIIGATFSADNIKTLIARTRESIGERYRNLSLSEQEQAAIDDYLAALEAAAPTVAEVKAKRLARALSDTDLASVDSFLESSAGRAYAALEAVNSKQEAADMGRISADIRKNANRTYCQKYACAPGVTPAGLAPAAKP